MAGVAASMAMAVALSPVVSLHDLQGQPQKGVLLLITSPQVWMCG